MPDANPPGYIETVAAADGRGETRLFIGVSLAVLILAAWALWLTQGAAAPSQARLPDHLSHFAIELGNAADELNMLAQAGLSMAAITVDDLPQSAALGLQQVDQDCFVAQQEGYLFALERTATEGWQVQWLASATYLDCHAVAPWHALTVSGNKS